MTADQAVFAADPEGWRSQNADRPPEHLVRELVQNALDEENVRAVSVTVQYHGPRLGTTVRVTDDSPTGVTDPKLLFTIWLSNKEDSPTKRGRMGRGLKELVSVSDETTIRSVGCEAVKFKRYAGGRWERKSLERLGRPERGTEVTAFCRAWGREAADSILKFLRTVRAPEGMTLTLTDRSSRNGAAEPVTETVGRFQAVEKYSIKLPTVMFEVVDGQRVERERERVCIVECFTPPPGEKAYVYEMGIPVEATESPVSIDVGQRVVLRERRDTLTEAYKRKLFAKVLSHRVEQGLVSDDQLRDNAAVIAASAYHDLSYGAAKKIAHVWTEGKPYAADSKMRAAATGHHIEVMNLRSLPESIRDIVRSWGTNVKDVMEARRSEFCPPVADLTADQLALKAFWEWCATGIGRSCQVLVRSGDAAMADFDRNARVLSVYTGAVDKKFFKDPAGVAQLGVLVHELSHWTPKADEHGSDFAHDNDDVGGQLANFLLWNAEQARTFLKPQVAQSALTASLKP